jgi:hypothetical protein
MNVARAPGTRTSGGASVPSVTLVTWANPSSVRRPSATVHPERRADPMAFASGVLVGIALALAGLAAVAMF